MLSTVFTPAIFAAALITGALADKAIPCAAGSGSDNGCGSCDESKGLEIKAWNSGQAPTKLDMPKAAAKVGGGLDVYWNIPQPGPGCRVIITQPYVTDKGSIDAGLSGNVILSTSHGGCFFAHVGSGGATAGFCCGSGDCAAAGAVPAAKKKRELKKKSRIMGNERRCWQGQDCPEPAPAPASSSVTCTKAVDDGDTYTKAGPQQIDGQTLNCNGGAQCSINPSIAVMTGTWLQNSKSTTITNGAGASISIAAGYKFPIGVETTVTATASYDWSKAVADATATTKTDSVTKQLSLTVGLVPGTSFNLWFTPTLRCQPMKTVCQGVDTFVEKCTPVMDGDDPVGDHGVMAIG